MNELALFAGAGGGILGGKLLGWRTVCAVERDAYAAQILAQRQNDRLLEPFPIWSDVQTFDGTRWRGIVDVVSGGFPCQDISAAGKGAGIEGARSGMWKEMARIIGEVRPRYAFVENSPMLTTRGLGTVLADLASLGFDAEWGVLSAADVGANHQRERIWILAHASQLQCNGGNNHDAISMGGKSQSEFGNDGWSQTMAHTNSTQRKRTKQSIGIATEHSNIGQPSWWKTEPDVGRVANGLAFGMDRLKAIGNGQVPLCAATAFTILQERLENGD